MVCATADELQARLAFRALLLPAAEGSGEAAAGGGGGAEEVGHSSALHRALRAEVDDVLKGGLQRRLAQLERKIELLCSDKGDGAQGSQPSCKLPVKPRDEKKPLSKALEKALKAAETAAKPPEKTFAPSPCQVAPALYWLGEVAEVRILEGEHQGKWIKCKVTRLGEEHGTYDITVLPTDGIGKQWSDMDVEDISPHDLRKVDPVDVNQTREEEIRETITLKATLENLAQNLSSRERQIGSLQQQLATVKTICAERRDEAEQADASFKKLVENPATMKAVQADRMGRRRTRVEEMTVNLRRLREQAKHYQAMAQQQRAFFLQSERIDSLGGPEVIARHPAGDVALTMQPPSLSDEQPEVWDVGSAVANPYVTDSWPFEPNVLARRAPQEGSMDPFTEETPEDLDERPRFRSNPFGRGLPSLRLPGRGDDSDDDDRYGGPSETSRSL